MKPSLFKALRDSSIGLGATAIIAFGWTALAPSSAPQGVPNERTQRRLYVPSRPLQVAPNEEQVTVAKESRLSEIKAPKAPQFDDVQASEILPELVTMPTVQFAPVIGPAIVPVVSSQPPTVATSPRKTEPTTATPKKTSARPGPRKRVPDVERSGPYRSSEVDVSAKATRGNAKPRYPSALLRRRRPPNGRVTLTFVIADDGRVLNPKVIERQGPEIFEREALAALRTWRFVPAQVKGRAVAMHAKKTIYFEAK